MYADDFGCLCLHYTTICCEFQGFLGKRKKNPDSICRGDLVNRESVFHSLCKTIDVLMIELLKAILIHGVADLLHEIVVKVEVMHNTKAHTQHFVCFQEVTDVGAGVILTYGTTTGGGDGTVIGHETVIEDGQLAFPSEKIAVTGVTGGHNAVEEVNATVNCL